MGYQSPVSEWFTHESVPVEYHKPARDLPLPNVDRCEIRRHVASDLTVPVSTARIAARAERVALRTAFPSY